MIWLNRTVESCLSASTNHIEQGIEQGTVPCFVMPCSMTDIKYTEQIIGSALFL